MLKVYHCYKASIGRYFELVELMSFVIDHVAREIICLVVSVCLWALSCLNHLTLIFGMRVDLNLG